MANFETVMTLIEKINTGKVRLESIDGTEGMIVPSEICKECYNDCNEELCCGNCEACENPDIHTYIEYDFDNVKADPTVFTSEQCKEIDNAWFHAHDNVVAKQDLDRIMTELWFE